MEKEKKDRQVTYNEEKYSTKGNNNEVKNQNYFKKLTFEKM